MIDRWSVSSRGRPCPQCLCPVPMSRYLGIGFPDGDFASKRIFSFLMIFFSLAETGVTPQAPVLTVPAS